MTPYLIHVYPARADPVMLDVMIDQLAPTTEESTGSFEREPRPFWINEERHRSGDVVRSVAPNWFAAVMGTGIVAIAAATLPLRVPGLRAFALAVWVLAAAMLVVFTGALAVQWLRHRELALAHAANPVMAQFWGAPAMALMTVGGATLLVGRDWLGLSAAVNTDWALWGLGTAFGLVTACWIPYLMMTRHEIAADGAFGGWLMPVVPPMVSAANGALLVPFAATGQGRLTLVAGCYAMFGISLFASLIIMPLIWSRLVTHKTLPAVMVPTCWILLGPLGQSITVRADLVELHVSGRDRRDRDHLAGRPHRLRCAARGEPRAVRAAGYRVACGAGAVGRQKCPREGWTTPQKCLTVLLWLQR